MAMARQPFHIHSLRNKGRLLIQRLTNTFHNLKQAGIRPILFATLSFTILLYTSHHVASSFKRPSSPCRIINNDDATSTSSTSYPLVCSHKGYHQPHPSLKSQGISAPTLGDGLWYSVTWLSRVANVKCFDMDVVLTKDGRMIVGHPGDMSNLLELPEGSSFSDFTLATLRDFEIKTRRRRRNDGDEEKTTTPLQKTAIVELVEFLNLAAGDGWVQLTLEPKSFPVEKLKDMAMMLHQHASSFTGATATTSLLRSAGARTSGAGLVMIVDSAVVDEATRQELSRHVLLSVGIREGRYGGDESIYCDESRVPRYVSYAMPHWRVARKCSQGWNNWAGVGVWLIDSVRGKTGSEEEWDVVRRGGVNAIVSNVPVVIAGHCMSTNH